MSDLDSLQNETTTRYEAPLSKPRRQRLAFKLSEETLATFKEEFAATGLPDHEAFLERLLCEQKRRREREAEYAMQANCTVTTDAGEQVQSYPQVQPGDGEQVLVFEDLNQLGRPQESLTFLPDTWTRSLFTAEIEASKPRCEVSIRERFGTTTSGRFVRIRTFRKQLDDTLLPYGQFYLARPLLPWLIEALQQGEAAIQEETTRKRRQAQDVRAARSVEEVTRVKELRQLYTERYSKERVTWAQRLASYHRGRAVRVGCTEHFTPWEWLDLCAQSDFGCSACGDRELLELHHRLELCRGGLNTIENLQLLCKECHREVEFYQPKLLERWKLQQEQFYKSFMVGDQVTMRHSKRRVGTIVGLSELRMGKGFFLGRVGSWKHEEDIISLRTRDEMGWAEATAIVSWPSKKSCEQTEVNLRDLVKVEENESVS